MNLNQVEYFLRVAELGSINRAAKELGLSQPALSRSLSQLEHDLGQQLVVRCRTGITITEAGSILASRGLALLREAGAIREELANDPAGRVVVGMPAALRYLITLPALQVMRSRSPATAVRVHEGFNVFLHDMMKHGLLDMAVIAVEQVSEVSIAPAMVVREPLVLVRSAKLPPPHDPVRIDDVVEFPLALPGRPNVVRGMVDRAIRERRLTAKVPLEPENPGLCLEFVRRGLVGQTVTLRSVLVERDTSGTHVASIDEWGLHWAFVVHGQRHNMVPVRRLAGIIKDAIVDAVRSVPWSGASIVGACEPRRQASGSAGRPRRNLP
jgi:LysR family nitrogen assimilation transcriptional regulator